MEQDDILDYEELSQSFNQALLHTLRQHAIADSILDYWVPDSDPVNGIVGMIDSARIAGHPEVSVRFRFDSIPEDRVPELRRAIEAFAEVSVDTSPDGMILNARNMSREINTETAAQVSKEEDRPAYWHSGLIAQDGRRGNLPWDLEGDSKQGPYGAIHPRLRKTLEAAAGPATHADDAAPAAEKVKRFTATGDEGLSITIDVNPESQIVARARHDGTQDDPTTTLLDMFCRRSEGLPFQEVADHVVLDVILSLVDEDQPPPVAGILLPSNSGPIFLKMVQLARQAFEDYRAEQGQPRETNFYYAPPAQDWISMSTDEQDKRVSTEISAFLQSNDNYPDDIQLLRVEDNKLGYRVRGVVDFSDRIDVDDKPSLMRGLEQHLRRRVERKLELVAERARDKSPLRRLSE